MKIHLILLFLFASLLVSSCQKEEQTDGTPGKPEIALIMKSPANEFFKTMADCAEAFEKVNSYQFSLFVN